MALQGTLKDFGLADIFQLIGIQRTTGVLTLEGDEDSVVVKFLDGQVVGADTRSESLENRLGAVLVRTGRITQSQLDEALAQQRSSLQRLGHILVKSGRISEEELIEALRIQSCEIIYRLFRWRDGAYHFHKVDALEYDRGHFTPISSETILMEGARMIDEWPIIERKIRSENTILRLTAAGARVDPHREPSLDADLDLGFGLDRPEGARGPSAQPEVMRLSPEERQVLSLIDGKRSVREICDLVALGEFETYRILAELLTRSVVEESRFDLARGAVAAGRAGWAGRLLPWLTLVPLCALVGLALLTLRVNPFTPWRLLSQDGTTEQLRLYASMARMEKVSAALDVYYLDHGTLPESIAGLTDANYVRAIELRDPWGRAYAYTFTPGGYSLAGLDGAGHPRPDLTVSRRFGPTQHLIAPPSSRR
jgi:hypothetical protein